MKIHKLALLIFVLSSPVAFAATYKLSSDTGHVKFVAKGKPALISIKGEGEGASGELLEADNILNGEIKFQLKSLKTGIELRDEHLKNKYLEVEKFPTAILKIHNLKIPGGHNNSFKFNGVLSLHGVDEPIEGSILLQSADKAQKISADFKIDLSRFKIEIPSFQGITVAEEVKVIVDATLLKDE